MKPGERSEASPPPPPQVINVTSFCQLEQLRFVPSFLASASCQFSLSIGSPPPSLSFFSQIAPRSAPAIKGQSADDLRANRA